MAVRIYLEIGHEASVRTKKTQEGFTHDWEVFVRGCDGAEIHYYVEKVVFYLHETFPKPKRVIKEPPYSVKESGYAGFNLPIDIYLRNNCEPKKIRFNYDLHLQQTGPAILKTQKEKYVFNSPTDEFRMKLLKGGGLLGSSSSSNQDVGDTRSTFDDKNQMTNKPKLSGSDLVKKQKIKVGEPCRDFQELFGSPINMSSKSSDQKLQVPKPDTKGDKSRTKHSPHKDTHKDKDKSKEKSDDKKNSKEEKKQKEKSKERKEKSVKKEKSPQRAKSPTPKRSLSPRFSGPVKHNKEKHDKEKRDKTGDKSKKEKKSKEHREEIKSLDEHKDPKRSEAKKETSKVRSEAATTAVTSPTTKADKKEKLSKDKAKDDKYKHKKKDKEKHKKEEKAYRQEKKPDPKPSVNLFKAEPPKKEKAYTTPVISVVDDDSSNSSSSSASVSPLPDKKIKHEAVKCKEDKNQKLKKEKSYQDSAAIKCKRKSSSDQEEPPDKVVKVSNASDVEEVKPGPGQKEEEENYFGLLRDLQHKIMGLKDNSDLQKVVKLIAETGRYEVSAHTFDFDLCLLDRSTVQQLQEFFAADT